MNNRLYDQCPKARTEKLVIKELPDEVLVYDIETDQAHCLNEMAARVWQNCDGKRTITQLRDAVQFGEDSPVPEEMIWLALDQLEKFRLLDNTAANVFRMPGMSRRDVVRRVGFAALTLPVIVSIAAPTANAQGSLLAPGRCCGNPNDCASNNCAQQPTCVSPPPSAPSTKACI